MRRAARSACLVAAVVGIAGGCARDVRTQNAAVPTPSSTAPSSTARDSTGGVTALPDTATLLRPGRYSYRAFRPAVTLQVPSGWEVGHRHTDFVDIWYDDAASLAFARPDFVIGAHGRVKTRGLSPA